MLAGCGDGRSSGPVRVSVIGSADQIKAPFGHITTRAGQLMAAATAQGLVSHDAAGNVIPGLAQRWIVVDDGLSYIFRLRRARWSDDRRVDARDVRRLLLARIDGAVSRDPYGVLAAITDVKAMTAEVIEIRLRSPQPDFLLALAQPQLGIALPAGGTGPYRRTRDAADREEGVYLLLPAEDNDEGGSQPRANERLVVRAERASRAMVRFGERASDLVIGGTIAEFPFIALSEVQPRSVRFDPVQGLFGLALSPRTPMFEDAAVREALSMAIDRQAIIAYFDMSRWKIAEQLLPQQLNLPHPPTAPGWASTAMEDRRSFAAGVIARWQAQRGEQAELTVALPEGPGMGLLFVALKAQLQAVGVKLRRVAKGGDLNLIDEVAPYDSVAWYLGRVSCARKVHCDRKAEDLLKQSVAARDMTERLVLLGQAEPLIQQHHGFIPLAMPVRWSLATTRLSGFEPSSRADRSLRGLVE